jgi:hypothetical protein
MEKLSSLETLPSLELVGADPVGVIAAPFTFEGCGESEDVELFGVFDGAYIGSMEGSGNVLIDGTREGFCEGTREGFCEGTSVGTGVSSFFFFLFFFSKGARVSSVGPGRS